MRWVWTKDEKPPKDEAVIGLNLYEYANADWEWSSRPYVYTQDGNYQEPTVWMRVELPEIPDTPARREAKRVGDRQKELAEKIAALRKEYAV